MIKVELLNVFGNDEMIANVARVSYAKEASSYTAGQNNKLLDYLIKHGHTSPFRHPQLQFRITCPIYVERQIFKHQVGVVVNSISGRYVDFSDTYTRVGVWRKQSSNSKQGSDGPVEDQQKCMFIERHVIDTCKKMYQELIDLGVSKEQARTILPLNLNTEYIWTGSLEAFMHLCKLRLKSDAQIETQQVVQAMLDAVKNLNPNPFKHSLELLGMRIQESKVKEVCG